MATNHIAHSIDSWDHVAAADISSNDVVEMGAVTGVALGDALTGEVVAVAVCGAFSLPKGVGEIAQGAAVEWTGTEVQALAAGTKIGVARSKAESADTAVVVYLER